MNLSFNKEHAWYGAKLSLSLIAVIFSGNMAAHGLDNFIKERDMYEYSYAPVPIKRETAPIYKEISPDAVIYASHHEVLKKRDELINESKNFIFIDLNTKELDIYQNGERAKSFHILTKGKENSLFETPSGYYKIKGKEDNHFSTIGLVWMPWSMHFFGNYFIHGWPYYPDGTPVAGTYSGGCIRLSDDDAEEIFKITKIGTPLLVYSGTTTPTTETTYFKKVIKQGDSNSAPHISADGVLVADFETGQVLFEKNTNVSYPIASITKLMSALAAMETISRFKVLTITQDSLAEIGDSGGLVIGETFKSEDLLYPLLLTSSNDVAKLFEKENRELVGTMNQKAQALGLYNTSFKDASGISSQNMSTPEDLFKLLQFLHAHKKPIFTVSGLKEYTLESLNKKKKHVWTNVNWTNGDDNFIGGKAGKTTQAGETMAGVFMVHFPEFENRPVVIIVLHSEDRVRDIEDIMRYLTQNFLYGTASLAKEQKRESVIIREGASIYEAVRRFISK